MNISDFGSSVWFGEKTLEPRNVIRARLDAAEDEISRFRLALELLKIGDVSGKATLADIMRTSNDQDARDVSIMAMCSSCSQEDICLFEQVLASGTQEDVATFVVYSPQTLSPKVIPLLLALREEYSGLAIEKSILFSLTSLFPIEKKSTEFDGLEDWFASVNEQILPDTYYLHGEMVHPGYFTKKLISRAAVANADKTSLNLMTIPMLLSVWSGTECPVAYSTKMDQEKLGEVLEYVKTLAAMNWRRGRKYFYGREVT